jgi:hypothetical protein
MIFIRKLQLLIGFSLSTALLFPISANANDNIEFGVSPGIGYEKVNGLDALGINAALDVKYNNLSASLEIIDVSITQGQNSGFYRDTFANGQSRCRNSSNGQFATNSSCSATGISTGFFRTLDATYEVPISENNNSIIAGIGTSLNEDNGGFYGVLGYRASQGFNVKAKIGTNKTDIRLVGFFRF